MRRRHADVPESFGDKHLHGTGALTITPVDLATITLAFYVTELLGSPLFGVLADTVFPMAGHAVPELPRGVREENDNIPKLSTMQIDLMVHALKADFARAAILFQQPYHEQPIQWFYGQKPEADDEKG